MARLRRPLPDLLAVAAVVVTFTLLTASPGWAGFSVRSQANQALASATLEAPSNLAVSTGCAVLVLGPKADLQWKATPSTFAAGYKVERWRGSTLQSTATVSSRTTTTLSQTGLSAGTTYTWRVYAYYQSWTSPVISASGTTPSLCL